MKLYSILAIICFPLIFFAQEMEFDIVKTKNAKESIRIAESYISQGNLEKGKRQLKHTIKIKKNFAVAWRELAKVHLDMEEYTEAIEAYEQSFEINEKLSRAAFFECGEAYLKSGNFEVAEFYYNKYVNSKDSSYANAKKESGLEKVYDDQMVMRQMNFEFIKNMDPSLNTEAPINLGGKINSKHDEYLPTLSPNHQELIYTRKNKKEDENILIAKKKTAEWNNPKSFGNQINTKLNEGMAKFETHGKSFYFAGCQRPDSEGGCDLYQAMVKDGEIEKVEHLDDNINSTGWDSQPTISCDGQLMFFCSTREGGLGGSDIWVSTLQENGSWGIPSNLGPKINTPFDEESPFIATDGKSLYFTSNGHPGQGDGDIFVSFNEFNHWTTPKNLGVPINSPAKEIGIYTLADGKTAYFASSREGGEGGLDLYSITLPLFAQSSPMVHLEGVVVDAYTKEPIETSITLGKEKEKRKVFTDEDGWFFLCVPGNKGYAFQIDEPGYEYFIEAQYLEITDESPNVKIELALQPKDEDPRPILVKSQEVKEKRVQFFFDFDSSNINEHTYTELKELIRLLDTDHNWKVEVIGYADNIGNEQYNKTLSEKRASAIVDYLKDSGVLISKVIKNEGKGAIKDEFREDEKKLSRRVDVVLRK